VPTLDSLFMNSLSSAITAGQLRQRVMANNIANANTPGYKEQSVQFESLLQQALNSQGYTVSGTNTGQNLSMLANNPLDIGGATNSSAQVAPLVSTDTSTSVSSNGNSVNIDQQMSSLAENQINYGALVQDLNDQFLMLRTAIVG